MSRRFLPLAAAVLVPVLVLAGFSWRGVQAQRRAAWAEKREEAERLADLWATPLVERLGRSAVRIPLYSDPPLPQASDEGSKRLDAATDALSLRVLRDDPNAGLTVTGLPVRVIAAARLLELEATPENAAALEHLASEAEPSVLTRPILDQAKQRDATRSMPSELRWDLREKARAIALRHPTADKSWVDELDGPWWIDRQAGQAIAPDILNDPAADSAQSTLPPWARLRFRVAGLKDYPDEPFAETAIKHYPGLSLQVTAPDPALIETGVREQERWALGMVGVSLLTALTGIILIQRLMARERKLNELKSHFVASVSHELRAPVGSIRLMADALDAGKVSPETAADFHRLISREGKRLTNLIENVLDFARIEQGRKRWHFEAADLPALVSDTVKVMEPLAAERRIALGFIHQIFDAEPVLDSAAIQQALVNLLDNAIKFSPPDSGIETILSSDERYWRLAVRDHGAGIPASERKKIFERFYRPGDELRRETQGTGIGLSLVKAIAEAHGGKVELDSQPGHGSTFTLVIPIDATAGH